MADNAIQLLDVEQILKHKMPTKYRYIPSFFVSYLKRILHQEELNTFIKSQNGVVGVDFLSASMTFLSAKVEVVGLDNLPKDRWCTFVSNHPLGGLDGVSLGYVLGNHYQGKIKYLVNDMLMNVANLAPLFVPVNKVGAQSRHFPQVVKATFDSENHILMFPAGLCSRKTNGVIKDLEWKKTFVVESIRSNRVVVPIHFEGKNSNRFYRLANICKFLGIKVNIAMLYLVDEMFKNRNQTFKITIGKPIDCKMFDSSKKAQQWAEYVKDIVYKL
ncbi:MAG: 1-acyl-sn-glycerol-3-phosphate acyltransferase [Bacteroidaceae bacterium]|nr:1-acyl-sn-glycerol-3-phosphate acyltransferase [Bacteroidaceae bacterium]